MIKPQVKKYTPAMTKIRGAITSTTKNIELNPTLSADDFSYAVPKGVRLTPCRGRGGPGGHAGNPAAARAAALQNACINNLRQIDGAKNEFALEKGKKNGDPVTEADIKPYIKLDANGNLPKCPGGGKYTIGKVGRASDLLHCRACVAVEYRSRWPRQKRPARFYPWDANGFMQNAWSPALEKAARLANSSAKSLSPPKWAVRTRT